MKANVGLSMSGKKVNRVGYHKFIHSFTPDGYNVNWQCSQPSFCDVDKVMQILPIWTEIL